MGTFRSLTTALVLFVSTTIWAGVDAPQKTDITYSGRLYRTSVYLSTDLTYQLRTYGSVDTVMYLLKSTGSGTQYTQYAYNDDCSSTNCDGQQGSLNSTILFTPPSAGYYQVVIRNYSNGIEGATGTFKLFRSNGTSSTYSNIPVGGYLATVSTYSGSYQSLPLIYSYALFYYLNMSKEESGGAIGNDTIMYLIKNQLTITDYDDDSGAAYASKIQRSSGNCTGGCKVLGGALTTNSQGKARIITNSSNFPILNDNDFDGLVNALETALGTSSTNSDSDTDGIGDFIETLGVGSILLPWEGSSPTQKDVFIEADYMPVPSSYTGRLYDDFLPDAITYHKSINPEYDLVAEMKYAFSQHGNIRLHFDIDSLIPYYKEISCSQQSWTDATIPDLADQYFTPERQGIYRYIIYGDYVTDSNGNESTLSIKGWSCGDNLMAIGLQKADDDFGPHAVVSMHELGHTLGLTHNGNAQPALMCDTHNSYLHRSIMNYQYVGFGEVPLHFSSNPLFPLPGSVYRYADDTSARTQYDQNNFDNNQGGSTSFTINWSASGAQPGEGCIVPYALSTKEACRVNPQPNCDCTKDEWVYGLNFLAGGAGAAMAAMILGSGQEEMPIWGINAIPVADNLEDMIQRGSYYRKSSEDDYFTQLGSWKREIRDRFLGDPDFKKRFQEEEYNRLKSRQDIKEGVDYEYEGGVLRNISHETIINLGE